MSPERQQSVFPYLYYENGTEAIDFICEAFGFTVNDRQVRSDGTLLHAEIAYDGDGVRVGTPPGGADGMAGSNHTASMFVRVADPEAHYAHAREAGAEIVDELEDQGYGLAYCASDPEGRRWYFCAYES